MTCRHHFVPAIVCGLPGQHCLECGRTDGPGGLVAAVCFDGVVIIEYPTWVRGFASWFFSPMEHWSSYWPGQGSCTLTSFFLLRVAWVSLTLAAIRWVLLAF